MKAASLIISLIALLVFPEITIAQGNPACNFAEPKALLQRDAYRAYIFQRTADNGASELTEISKGIYLKIQQNQCVDFMVRKFIFTLETPTTAQPLGVAIKEISNLKFSDARDKPNELLSFLKTGYGKSTKLSFSACKNGTSAPQGECTWESGGGFSYQVSRKKNKMTISVTEYTSG